MMRFESYEQRIDHLESMLTFQMNVLLYLIAAQFEDSPSAVQDAIITARRGAG